MNSQREGLEEVMRVIAGKYKSRQLKAVPTKLTRPTTDKNKENLYNMIGPYFDGGICLDLFAGSGGRQAILYPANGSIACCCDAWTFAYSWLSYRWALGICNGYAYDAGRFV